MLPSPIIGLLIAVIPGLAPFAGILALSATVIQAIKLAMDTMTVMRAITLHAPHLVPTFQKLAEQSGTSFDNVGRAMFAPHQLTIPERDYWTDHLNKAMNL